MANPENSNISFAEKVGYIARNFGIVLTATAGAILAPQYLAAIFAPSVALAIGGEALKNVSQ